MIKLYDESTNAFCGSLTDEQFKALCDVLEEESPQDVDYYITRDTVDLLESEGADAGLVAVLRAALGDRSEMDIRWERA